MNEEENVVWDNEPDVIKPEDTLRLRAQDVLARLKEKYPQYELNGCHNIWILKPAGLSRGRGISIYNNLGEIINNCSKEH